MSNCENCGNLSGLSLAVKENVGKFTSYNLFSSATFSELGKQTTPIYKMDKMY